MLTLILALLFALTPALVAFAQDPLIALSRDPYTNPTSNHNTEVEPDTFAFGTTIVAAFQVGRFFNGGASNIGWATSTNGGRTWTRGFLPGITLAGGGPYGRASDPSVAYDAKHKTWLISYLAFTGTQLRTDVLVSRSTTGGLTWDPPVIVNATGQSNDKNWTVCDNTPSSSFYGHCYTEFDDNSNLNQVQMSTSTNGGLVWGPAKTTPDHTCVLGGQPLVQPNGTVVVPIADCNEAAILAFRSTDGGQTWTKPVMVAQIIFDGDPGNIRTGLPTAEIDKGGRVYVVWSDCRFEAACNAPIGTNDLVMSTSDDGIHWTLPQRIPINPVGSGADHLIPGLAVDRNTAGTSAQLGLAYYYFPNSNCTPSTCQLNVGFISSTNGGSSWSAPEHLAGPMNLTWLPLTTLGYMVGDYISTSIVPGSGRAAPVFAVAKAPTASPSCSSSTGASGAGCHEAMYTEPEGGLVINGGTNVAHDVAPTHLPHKPGLSKPATAQ